MKKNRKLFIVICTLLMLILVLSLYMLIVVSDAYSINHLPEVIILIIIAISVRVFSTMLNIMWYFSCDKPLVGSFRLFGMGLICFIVLVSLGLQCSNIISNSNNFFSIENQTYIIASIILITLAYKTYKNSKEMIVTSMIMMWAGENGLN